MLVLRKLLVLLVLAGPGALAAQDSASGAARAAAVPAPLRWYRGNTHTHTWNSDGDSPPDAVLLWYRDRGYQFVVLTDHEWVTDVASLNALYATPRRFLAISGQEVTQRVADSLHPGGIREAHLNAIGIRQVILPQGDAGVVVGTKIGPTLRRNAGLIRDGGGIPQANHPNLGWSVPSAELLSLPDSSLLEIFNGHPLVNNEGGTSSAGVFKNSTEAIWDTLLTRGKVIFGVASDDMHSLRPSEAERADLARPGRGWIQVRAETLSTPAILSAIRRGDFYASNGVTLRAYDVTATDIRVSIEPQNDRRYRTEFIGSGGRILATSYTYLSTYRIVGNEGYVRARVVDSAGRRAWMQPVIVRGR